MSCRNLSSWAPRGISWVALIPVWAPGFWVLVSEESLPFTWGLREAHPSWSPSHSLGSRACFPSLRPEKAGDKLQWKGSLSTPVKRPLVYFSSLFWANGVTCPSQSTFLWKWARGRGWAGSSNGHAAQKPPPILLCPLSALHPGSGSALVCQTWQSRSGESLSSVVMTQNPLFTCFRGTAVIVQEQCADKTILGWISECKIWRYNTAPQTETHSLMKSGDGRTKSNATKWGEMAPPSADSLETQ